MSKKYMDKKDGAIRSFDLRSRKNKILFYTITAICFICVIVCLFPAVWLFLASFKDLKEFKRNVTIFPSSFDFSRLKETWDGLNFTKYYINSLISVAGSVVSAVFFNGLLAYALGVLKPKGHKVIFGLVMWCLLIPTQTSIIALVRNLNLLGLSGSFVPLWLSFGANAFYVVLFKQFFEGLSQELLEAAKLDGAGVLGVFTRIILPLSRPIIMVVAIFAITAAWSDFLLPYLMLNGSGKETVMIKLFAYKDAPTNVVNVLRAVLFSIIPPTILFVIFQKQITDNAASGAVKG